MFRCWMLVVLAAAIWAKQAEAAELTGFGPIKFGMAKEQAEAALEAAGIEWEWKTGTEETFEESYDFLLYEYPIHNLDFLEDEEAKLEIAQAFENGNAIRTNVSLTWPSISPGWCFIDGLNIVSAVVGKYTESRLIQEQIDGSYWFNGEVNIRAYLVTFENDAFIKILLADSITNDDDSKCEFWLLYYPPAPNPIPF